MFEARLVLEVSAAGLAAERVTGNDLAAIAEEVASLFASMDEPADMPWGVRAFRAKDPDGFKFSFSSERK